MIALFCIAKKIMLLYKTKCLNSLVLYFINNLQYERHLCKLHVRLNRMLGLDFATVLANLSPSLAAYSSKDGLP